MAKVCMLLVVGIFCCLNISDVIAVPPSNLYLHLLNLQSNTQRQCGKECINGGVCELTSGSRSTYSKVTQTCKCPDAFTGEFCQTHNPSAVCDPPCVGGQGDCVYLSNSRLDSHLEDKAYCDCRSTDTGYYIGDQCETHHMSECGPPCLNGGSCFDKRCTCMYGADGYYYGNQCQYYYVIDFCEPTCKNGAECKPGGECDCPRNSTGHFDGQDCGYFVTENCNPGCLNGATCQGDYCQCKSDIEGYYFGDRCESYKKYSTCDPTCMHGECNYGFCDCIWNSTGRYVGQRCDVYDNRYDPCGCQNGAVCEYGVCQCVSNTTHRISGTKCEEVSYECSSPCQNGAECHYDQCVCPFRYSGDRCENYLHDCPCQHGGLCSADECFCQANLTHAFNSDLCQYSTDKLTCFPTPLNGGVCQFGQQLCPYDDVGYFHGDQCREYSRNSCSKECTDVQVCIGDKCKCPYSVVDRSYQHGKICEHKMFF